MAYIGDHQKVSNVRGVKRCHPAVQRAIKWAHPANLSRAIGEAGGATGRKNVGHTTIAATRSTSRSTQTAAAHRSEPGSRGVGSDNCEQTTPSARRLGVTQREYSDSLTLDSGRCEHRLHNAVSLLRDLSACIVDATHFGLPLVSAFMAIDNERPTPKRHPVEVRGTPHTQIHRCRNAT